MFTELSKKLNRLVTDYGPFTSLTLVLILILLLYLTGWQTIMGAIFRYLLVPYFALLLSSVSASLRLHSAVVSNGCISLMN